MQRKQKPIFTLILLMVLSIALAACGGKNEEPAPGTTTPSPSPQASESAAPSEEPAEDKNTIRVAMVTDIGGVHDNSFNQSAWEGLQEFNRLTGSEVDYLQSNSDADYVPNLTQFVRDGWDLTWGIGFLMGDSIKEVAEQHPNSKFAIIDDAVEAPNVAAVTFKENEGSYLVGVVAGLMTTTNKIGFIGGIEIPVIKRFELGFVEGVKAVNPDAEVLINYTGSFDQPDQGKAAAATLYNSGADIVFHAAGATGDGLFNEAQEQKKSNPNIWAIGVDKDQAATFGHDITLTSMMKYVDRAMIMISQSLLDGNFQGGVQNLGLAEDMVGLPENNPNIPADVLQKVEEYKQKIISGEIVVPTA